MEIPLSIGRHVVGVSPSKNVGDGWAASVPDQPNLLSPNMKAEFEVLAEGQVVAVTYRPRLVMGALMRGTLTVC